MPAGSDPAVDDKDSLLGEKTSNMRM